MVVRAGTTSQVVCEVQAVPRPPTTSALMVELATVEAKVRVLASTGDPSVVHSKEILAGRKAGILRELARRGLDFASVDRSPPAAPVSMQVEDENNAWAQVTQLEHALATRTVISQAVGMVMERFGMSPEDAFGLLQTVSNHTNRKLRDIAAGVVTGQGAGHLRAEVARAREVGS